MFEIAQENWKFRGGHVRGRECASNFRLYCVQLLETNSSMSLVLKHATENKPERRVHRLLFSRAVHATTPRNS